MFYFQLKCFEYCFGDSSETCALLSIFGVTKTMVRLLGLFGTVGFVWGCWVCLGLLGF